MRKLMQFILALACVAVAGYGLYAIYHDQKHIEKHPMFFVAVFVMVIILASAGAVIAGVREIPRKDQTKRREVQ